MPVPTIMSLKQNEKNVPCVRASALITRRLTFAIPYNTSTLHLRTHTQSKGKNDKLLVKLLMVETISKAQLENE